MSETPSLAMQCPHTGEEIHKDELGDNGDDCKDYDFHPQLLTHQPQLHQVPSKGWLDLLSNPENDEKAGDHANLTITSSPHDFHDVDDDFSTCLSPEMAEQAKAYYCEGAASPEFFSHALTDDDDEVDHVAEVIAVELGQSPESQKLGLPSTTLTSTPLTHLSLSPNPSLANSNPRNNTSKKPEPETGQPEPGPKAQARSNTPNFMTMPLADILPLTLTIRELVDFDLIGRFMASHNGSRYVQHIMHSINGQSDELELLSVLLRYLVHHTAPLLWNISTSVYGNYLIQTLFEKTAAMNDPATTALLLESFLFPSVLELSTTRYGCRVVQSAIKHCSRAHQQSLVKHFETQCAAQSMVPVTCLHASHALQAMLRLQLPVERVVFIREALEADLEAVCSDVSGCRVVQCFVGAYPSALSVAKLVRKRLHLALSTRQYGNYVVQCVATKMPEFGEKLICDAFRQRNLHRLATDKHGSNVLEKCVKLATTEQRARLIHVLKAKRCSLLKQLAWDEFGNYVIGTLLECSDNEQRRELIRIIHERVVDLRHGSGQPHGYGYAAELVAKCRAIRRMGSAYRGGGGDSSGYGRGSDRRTQKGNSRGRYKANAQVGGFKARCERFNSKHGISSSK